MTDDCPHKNWRVYDSDRIGFASCLDCKDRNVPLPDLFNNMKDRYDELIAELERRIAIIPAVYVLDEKCPGCDESLRGGRTIQASDGRWVHYMTGCYEDYENKLKASQSAKRGV